MQKLHVFVFFLLAYTTYAQIPTMQYLGWTQDDANGTIPDYPENNEMGGTGTPGSRTGSATWVGPDGFLYLWGGNKYSFSSYSQTTPFFILELLILIMTRLQYKL
jgi:hypothetical protein